MHQGRPLSTKLGDVVGFPRREQPEPDRRHVERPRHVFVTADKPPLKLPPRTEHREFYTPEFRAEVMNDFRSTRAREPHLTQKQYAERIGLRQSTLSKWVSDEARNQQAQQQEQAQQQAQQAPAPAPANDDAVGRSIDRISRELADALACVRALKAELRKLIGD